MRDAGDLDGARKALAAALERTPGDTRISIALAEIAFETRDAEALEKLIVRIPSGSLRKGEAQALQFRLGSLLLEGGDFEGALRVFDACLKQRADWPEARVNYGLALWRSGHGDPARKIIDEVLRADPKQVEALYASGYLAIEREDYKAALDAFLKLSTNGERTVELFYNTGLLLQHFGRLEDALTQYGEALKDKPGMTEVLDRMGQVASALGRLEEAKRYWNMARDQSAEVKLAPSG